MSGDRWGDAAMDTSFFLLSHLDRRVTVRAVNCTVYGEIATGSTTRDDGDWIMGSLSQGKVPVVHFWPG
jgi:hypothetical protein